MLPKCVFVGLYCGSPLVAIGEDVMPWRDDEDWDGASHVNKAHCVYPHAPRTFVQASVLNARYYLNAGRRTSTTP